MVPLGGEDLQPGGRPRLPRAPGAMLQSPRFPGTGFPAAIQLFEATKFGGGWHHPCVSLICELFLLDPPHTCVCAVHTQTHSCPQPSSHSYTLHSVSYTCTLTLARGCRRALTAMHPLPRAVAHGHMLEVKPHEARRYLVPHKQSPRPPGARREPLGPFRWR